MSADFSRAQFEQHSSAEREARIAIEAHQRRRALLAVAELAHQDGIGAVTNAGICRLARLRRATFGSLFASREDCLSLALLAAHSNLFEPVRRASVAAPSWYVGMAAALAAFFEQIVAEPLPAELYLLHSRPALPGASGGVAGQDEIEAIMAGGREAGRIAAAADYREPAPELEEFLARAALWLVTLRIQQGDVARLPGDVDKLVALAAGAFFGIGGTGQRWRELQASCRDESETEAAPPLRAEKHNDPGATARGRRLSRP